jgi:HK97 family phage portal protein
MERPASLGRFPSRSLVRSEDPRLRPANENGVGPNDPPASVGPTSSTNYPGNFVLPASAWSGWPSPSSTGIGPSPWDTPYLEPFSNGNGEWSGFGYGRQNPDSYLKRVSTVMTCVDLNSRQLGSFPIYGTDRNRRPVALPSWSITPEPTVYADWSVFMKAAANSFQLTGETILFATARGSNGFPARFVALNPATVSLDPDTGLLYLNGESDPLDPADVLVIPYQTLPGKFSRGIGPLMWTGQNLVSAAALERYASEIATHGVWALLKHPGNLDAGQATDLKAGWMSARALGPGAPAVLSGGVEFETLSLSPKDMALLDLKTYDEQRIASAFGVPPFLVGLEQPGSMTYSNANGLFDFHWRATLRPMASSFAAAMSAWLLPRGTSFWFNRDEYVKPGLGERASSYATLHSIVDEDGRPAITTDEVRIAEGFAPYGGTGSSREVGPSDVAVLTGTPA